MADSYFTVHAKDPEMEAVLQKIIDFNVDKDEFRDMLGLPRKGREPDYLYGHWCIRCHNSLPEDWKDPCDVCGAATVMPWTLEGLLKDEEKENVDTTQGQLGRPYEGIVRGSLPD